MAPVWQALKKRPHFVYLLPLFFVFHGYVENVRSVLFSEAFGLAGEYLLATAVILVLLLLFLPSKKAVVFVFALFFFHFFFGAFLGGLKKVFADAFVTRYSFLLPVALIAFAVLFFYLKRTKKTFGQLYLYLNLLLLLLSTIDLVKLAADSGRTFSYETVKGLRVCDSCNKPDIYLIIADEYADSTSLQDEFGFNNTAFQNQLRSRGFYVANKSRSNYNFTPFSMGALLKMDYLHDLDYSKMSAKDLNICYDAINRSAFAGFLATNGYAIKNFSIFNLGNQPKKATLHEIVVGRELISSNTFLQRLRKDIGYHLITTLKLQFVSDYYLFYTKKSNEKLLNLLRNEAQTPSAAPRFIYTHILMPHYPYYYNAKGIEQPKEKLVEGNEPDKKAYIEYLQYGNGIYLALLDHILKHSAKPPIIVFMGDHGFRWFGGAMTNKNGYYTNLNAVYLPNKQRSFFYDGISGANQFRALLNACFAQRLPYLKDSSAFIRE